MPTLQTDQIEYEAEINAANAATLAAFDGLSLAHVKRELATLLSTFGRNGIFREYTTHDITHINEMLRIAGMIIPQATKATMTPADWLLIVLGIYFHDAGMIVTEEEFRNRSQTDYAEFEKGIYFSKEARVVELRTKLAAMEKYEAEKFLYQEYVRKTHAVRIRAWVAGERAMLSKYSMASQQGIFDNWLGNLPPLFRDKLGLICESHHLDDLADFKKYPTSMPFGRTEQEQANVQFCALILRTADLLHMTSDRTPSVAFQIISPSDPISQREWAKQRSVTSVRPAKRRNADGDLDASLQSDTIEVHAQYDDPNGFFALTDFLQYVNSQLKQSYAWAKAAHAEGASGYEFPWRQIDSENVVARGFLSQKFEFTLDQGKILELLTGHTLYNDSKVAIRELIQNAIDAIRLQKLIDGEKGIVEDGYAVRVFWDASTRALEIIDNGTGMTQAAIENHFLKVGNSRYQDARFQKQYPNFSPISRFGIGVLSCFMMSDNVAISTYATEEEHGRHIKLKSVHGQYLIRLLDKATDPDAKRVGPHGTIVRLQIRHSVDVGDVESILSRWVIVPPCKVELYNGGESPMPIGWASTEAALAASLNRAGIEVSSATDDKPANKEVRLKRTVVSGLDLCFAVRWSEYFQQWSFLPVPDHDPDSDGGSAASVTLGMCVEGVRITFGTPGYLERTFFALANFTDKSAPRPNVARTDFELTPELESAYRKIYGAYVQHVNGERRALAGERKFSESWSIREARILAQPLFGHSVIYMMEHRAGNGAILTEQLGECELVIVENFGKREAATINALRGHEYFWTIDSQLFRSIERLLEEYGGSASVASVLNSLGETGAEYYRSEPVLFHTSYETLPENLNPLMGREIDTVRANARQRRVDLRWRRKQEESLWAAYAPRQVARHLEPGERIAVFQVFGRRVRVRMPHWVGVAKEGVVFDGLDQHTIGVKALRHMMFSSDNKIGAALAKIMAGSGLQGNSSSWLIEQCVVGIEVVEYTRSRGGGRDAAVHRMALPPGIEPVAYSLFEEFVDLLWDEQWRIYNVSHWVRGSSYETVEFEY